MLGAIGRGWPAGSIGAGGSRVVSPWFTLSLTRLCHSGSNEVCILHNLFSSYYPDLILANYVNDEFCIKHVASVLSNIHASLRSALFVRISYAYIVHWAWII